MNTSRKADIDTAKGLGIILVSIYHLVYRPENGTADIILCELIWLFVPFFFVLSGWNFRDERTLRENVMHRLKVLFLPALKYTMLLLLFGGIYCMAFHGCTAQDWLRDAIHTYLRPEFASALLPEWGVGGILFECISPVWFVWTMVLSYMVFYPVSGYALKDTACLCVSCVVLLSAGILLYAAIMLCGAWLSRHSGSIRPSVPVAAAAVVLHAVMYHFCGNDYAFASQLGTVGRWSVIPFFVQTFTGGYAVYVFCKLCPEHITKILAFVGRNSFRFLLLHGIFAMIASDLLHTYIKLSPDRWYVESVTPEVFAKSVMVWVFSVICCTVFCMVQERREILKGGKY